MLKKLLKHNTTDIDIPDLKSWKKKEHSMAMMIVANGARLNKNLSAINCSRFTKKFQVSAKDCSIL